MFKNIIALVLMAFSFSAFSVTSVADQFKACDSAVKAGKASFYTPSFIASSTRVDPGEEIRPLEASYCADMETVSGRRVVVLAAGSPVVFKAGTNDPVRHGKCNNVVYGGRYVENHSTVLVSPQVPATIPAVIARAPSSVGGYPPNGEEVCDAIGNCSRNTQGGSMVCQNGINGKVLEYDFAPLGLTPEQARSYCRASGDRFLARHRAVTPDQTGVSATPVAVTAGSGSEYPVPVLASAGSTSSGNITCEFKVNGVVRESYKTVSREACSASNLAKARALGLVPAQ